MSLETAREVALIGKAASERNLCDRVRACAQHSLRTFNQRPELESVHRQAKLASECVHQMKWTESDGARHRADRHVVGAAIHPQLTRSGEPMGSGFRRAHRPRRAVRQQCQAFDQKLRVRERCDRGELLSVHR
jgi:hypothetical protein